MTTTHWDNFIGECSIALLLDQSSEPAVRHLAASSVASFYYVTTRLTMRTAFRMRNRLGEDFVRLQNLAVLWAGLRSVMARAEASDCIQRRWDDRRERLLNRFVSRAIPGSPISWEKVGGIASRSIDRIHRKQYAGILEYDDETDGDSRPRRESARPNMHTSPTLDFEAAQAAFDWLQWFDQTHDRKERADWIGLLENALSVVIGRVGSRTDDEEEIAGTPYAYDHWVFDRIAQGVPRIESIDEAAMLWRPILNLGAAAHYWVTAFLADWFTAGATSAGTPDRFTRHWRAMIEHALGSPAWQPDTERRAWHLDDMHIELMGLGWGATSIRDGKYAGDIRSLMPLYEVFAARWLDCASVAARFAGFLVTAGGRQLLTAGMPWLHHAAVDYHEYSWTSEGLEDKFAGVLRACWLYYADELRTDEELRRVFLDFLALLVQRQCGAALHLRDSVLESLGG